MSGTKPSSERKTGRTTASASRRPPARAEEKPALDLEPDTTKQSDPTPAQESATRNETMAAAKDNQPKWTSMKAIDLIEVQDNPIMVADSTYVIRHMNSAALAFFEEMEADIQEELPRFRARDILGSSIDVFHKKPSYQHRVLDGMKNRTSQSSP